MAKYQKYAEYKDSGVEWLGEIPQEWSIVSIARVSNKITNGYVGATRDIFYDTGIRYLQSLHIKKNKINFHTPYYVSEDWSNEKSKSILKEGDVLIVQTGDIGQVAAVTKEFEGCNCHALIIVSGNEKIWGFYLSWLLNSDYGRQTLKSIQTGALHPHLNCDAIKDVKITLPDIQIQKNISNFLDHETAKIDTLIAKQEKLIELLKEKRQAVISHAVTKGLNPNVPMKDSGVEWLGEVPEHWKIGRIKDLALVISKGTTPSTMGGDFVDDGIRFLKAENIGKRFDVNPTPEFFITEQVDEQLSRSRLQENDVLVIIAGATTGLASVLQKELLPANTNQAVSFVRLKNIKYSHWVAFWLTTRFAQSTIWMGAVQSAQPNLSMESLGNITLPIPDPEEVEIILEKIQLKLQTFDLLIIKSQEQIALMQERRIALISAAVTGKIDVRHHASRPTGNDNHQTEVI